MRFLGYLPAVLWAGFVLFLGSRPFTDVPGFELPVDKAVHFTLYGVLGLLAAIGWRVAGRRPHLLVPLLAALLVGGADELLQRRIPSRSADWADWGADIAGIGLAFVLVARHRRVAEGKGE